MSFAGDWTRARCDWGFATNRYCHDQGTARPAPLLRTIHIHRCFCEGAEQTIPKQVDHRVVAACVAVMHIVQLAMPAKPARACQPTVLQVVVLMNIGVRSKGDEQRRRKAHEWGERQYQAEQRDQRTSR